MLLLLPAAAPPDAEVLRQAESAFQDGVRRRERPTEARQAFARAAEGYEELRRRGAANASLFRDEGDAYLLAGDLPRAILAYRRGLRLAPNDAVLRGNLEHARAQVSRPPPGDLGRPPAELWPPWVPRVPSGVLLVLSLLLYGLGCLSLTRWWMVRQPRLVRLGIFSLVGALFLGGLLAARGLSQREEACHPLVVLADDGVLLRRGNGLSYPPRYETPLNRGVEARLVCARGDWLKVVLAGGETGWVPRRYALLDAEALP
jgi:hypothetical protein